MSFEIGKKIRDLKNATKTKIKTEDDTGTCQQKYSSFKQTTSTPSPTRRKENYYPNCDSSVWLRSCEQEIIEPINGVVMGNIPKWLNGSLLRNGPGSLKVGPYRFKHLFDSSALLHRFSIKNGNVTYQCRFIQTNTYKRNTAANRIVITEFGTCSVPDPCHTIFDKITAIFQPTEDSDNAMISVYPYGDEYFAFTECPIIHNFDTETLETKGQINVADYIGIVNHTSHPHIMKDGTVYNLGMSVTRNGPFYNIICFPNSNGTHDMFRNAHIVATIPVRWKLHPSYMHTFGITDNFFIIVEQPLSISVTKMLKTKLLKKPMVSSFQYFPEKFTQIYIVNRQNGQLMHTFKTQSFFYLHIINQYEIDNYIILDICCYKDPAMLDCMYVEAMENMQQNANYANMFRGKPLRFVLPLISKKKTDNLINKQVDNKLQRSMSLFRTNLQTKIYRQTSIKMSQSIIYQDFYRKFNNENDDENSINDQQFCMDSNFISDNLIKLPNTKATAYQMTDHSIYCKPELLCDLGCETPRISYDDYLGKKYQYFYAISSDVDADHPGKLIKVDVINKTHKTWFEKNCYPSEPIFVPSPLPNSEDDGVILASMVWGNGDDNRVGLIVLCAREFIELGRCEFKTPGPVPKCLHGWFTKSK